MKLRLVALLIALMTSGAAAQPVVLRGRVYTTNGVPVAGANVFVVGSLDGALTDSVGAFRFSAPRSASLTLAIRRLGFRDRQIDIVNPARELDVILEPEASRVAAMNVQASRYVAGDEAGAALTPLEIVTIPGTAADVNRAIQSLPGVQQVDEGTGLFVRGGDFTETRVFLNEGLLLTPAQIQSPAGTFVGTLDPFLLDGVYFTSGGFGARYGDALSAIALLNTRSRPTRPELTVSTGLAAIGANVALPGPGGTSLALVADRNDLTPVLRLNGSPRQFSTPPRGADRTMSLHWDYRPTAKLSLFATEQTGRVAALNTTPSVSDTFATAGRERAVVLSWRDVVGRFSPGIVLSSSAIRRTESFGSYELAQPQRLEQGVMTLDVALGDRVVGRVGGETGRLASHIDGSVPASGADQRPGSRVRLFEVDETRRHRATFAELDVRPTEASHAVIGFRRDWSASGEGATLDPRASGSLRVRELLTVTGALGVYHQTVDPLLETLAAAGASLPSMRARHAIVGVQIGESTPMLRVEAYHKRYSDLAAQSRDFITIGGGSGTAGGVDVMARAPQVAGVSTRLVYSYVRSVRTDPNSGALARAPFDVPHNITSVFSRSFVRFISTSASFRYASGRPYTPVIGATRSPDSPTWIPRYGAPNSERLPAFARVDFSASWYRPLASHGQFVAYVAVTNVLDRSNVYVRQYTADYTSAYDVRSIFNRAVYFGGVLTLTGN